jgi:hypothetical protein
LKRRTRRILILALVAPFVLAVIFVLVQVFRARSMASARTAPVNTRYFITPDASCVFRLRARPGDEGMLELLEQAAGAYDRNRTARAGRWEKLVYFLLGFERPSEAFTRPLPIEAVAIVRYDPRAARFHSYAVYSVSGMAPLLAEGADHLPTYAPRVARRYARRLHSDETLHVPDNGAGPPGARLAPSDVTALWPPGALTDAAWAVVDNNLLVARRPESLAIAVDDLKAFQAGVPRRCPVVLPDAPEAADVTGVVRNEHGELLCALALLAELAKSDDLVAWLARPEAKRDAGTVRSATLITDLRPADRMVTTVRFTYTSRSAMLRVFSALAHALREWRPPPPIRVRLSPSFGDGTLSVEFICTGLGAYLEDRLEP